MILNFTSDHMLKQVMFYVCIAVIFLLGTVASAQCNGELIVEKNRNYKSVSEKGANYTMLLTNTSSSPATYTIKSQDISATCSNKARATRAANVSLIKAVYKKGSKNALTEKIKVMPGQTYEFNINVTAPEGTPYNTWGCIEVKAIPDGCTQSSISTILSVFVPDPTEE